MTEEGGALAKIAKAIASVHPAGCTDDEARAIVGAIAEAGYAVVPVEPSEAMVEDGCAAYWPVEEFCTGPITNGERAVRAYRAMIEAGSVKT